MGKRVCQRKGSRSSVNCEQIFTGGVGCEWVPEAKYFDVSYKRAVNKAFKGANIELFGVVTWELVVQLLSVKYLPMLLHAAERGITVK
jgi:hypothetical protein